MVKPPEERSRGALFLMVALVAAAALWFVLGEEGTTTPIGRGSPAPDFSLPRVAASSGAPGAGTASEAGAFELGAHAGRVVLVNFWATWCEPCEREMPAMQRLYERLPRDRFELVAVTIDDEVEKVLAFQARYALTFPIAMDRDKAVSRAYQTMGVPESILIDRDGRMVERYVGPREWDAPEYVERIESLFETGSSAGSGAAQTRAQATPAAAD